MTVVRRLALALSIALCGSIAFAGASIASGLPLAPGPPGPPGPPAPPPAGNYNTTTLRADYSLPSVFPAPQITVFVTQTTQESHPHGGPATVTHETDVFFQVFSPIDSNLSGGGCFILAHPSDFNISGDLQTATLNTQIPGSNGPCSPPETNGNLPPITLKVTWSGASATATTRDNKRFDCLTYRSDTRSRTVSNNATATATLTPLFTGSFTTARAGLGSGHQRTHVEGTFQSACPPGPGGKGSGSGPLPAGRYHFMNQIASFSSSTDSGSIFISVNNGIRTSHPVGAPSTSTTETDVFVQDFSSTGFFFGCFILDQTVPPQFTFSSSLQAAALHAKITPDTKTCQSPFNPPPQFLSVDVTWTGTGPIATTRDSGHFSCLTFSTETEGRDSTNNANATATVPELFAGTLKSSQGNLISSDVRIHIEGVDPDPCIFRT